MNWIFVKEQLPKQHGWYLGAINPNNYKELNTDEINMDVLKFGLILKPLVNGMKRNFIIKVVDV